MEVPAIIVAVWFVLVCVYTALYFTSARRRRIQERQQATIRSAAFSARTGASPEQPVLGGLFSEVETLRLQVETLRSEMSALQGMPRGERARMRRPRPGPYTDLPHTLRRQVREVRSVRHPAGV